MGPLDEAKKESQMAVNTAIDVIEALANGESTIPLPEWLHKGAPMGFTTFPGDPVTITWQDAEQLFKGAAMLFIAFNLLEPEETP